MACPARGKPLRPPQHLLTPMQEDGPHQALATALTPRDRAGATILGPRGRLFDDHDAEPTLLLQGTNPPVGGSQPDYTGRGQSFHPGGVNVGFLDGSVRFVKDGDNTAWWGLATKAGGEVALAPTATDAEPVWDGSLPTGLDASIRGHFMSNGLSAAALVALVKQGPGLGGVRRRAGKGLAGPCEVAESLYDVWGEAARHPAGRATSSSGTCSPRSVIRTPSFALPDRPVSAPRAQPSPVGEQRAAVNLRADKPPMWKEAGHPVAFFVGSTRRAVRRPIPRLDGPRYPDGYLPVLRVDEREGQRSTSRRRSRRSGARWPTTGRYSSGSRSGRGRDGDPARLDGDNPFPPRTVGPRRRDGRGATVPGWTWDGEPRPAGRAVGRRSMDLRCSPSRSIHRCPGTAALYDAERRACARAPGRRSSPAGPARHPRAGRAERLAVAASSATT